MKKIIGLVVFLFLGIAAQAQQDLGIVGTRNWLNGWSSFSPADRQYPNTTKILTGNISSDLTLSNFEVYNLVGEVYVTNNAVLTIEPGTIIRASASEYSSLIITKGSKLIADGQVTNPIVFTSDKPVNERKSGDWGGIYILGNAPVNTYGSFAKINADIPANFRAGGGTVANDNSGVLKNLRIEFAGKSKSRAETNSGITFVCVGSSTIIESLQVSVSDGNAYKFIGGSTKASKLVSYRSKSSDFTFTQGATANIDNGLVLRNPYFSSSSGFRGVTVENYENQELTDFSKPATNVTLDHFTILNEKDNGQGTNGLIKEAIYVFDGSLFNLKNSVVSGFESALLLDSKISVNDTNLNKIKIQRVFINNCNKNIVSEQGGVVNNDLEFYYAAKSFANIYSKASSDELFVDASNLRTPDFRIKIDRVH